MHKSADRPVVYLARTTFRNEGRLFGIRERDRLSHLYIIGKTGTGKSTLLRTMILQDVAGETGMALFDPHGDLVESVVPLVPAARQSDLIYLSFTDADASWHVNPFADVPAGNRSLAAAGIVEVFKKLWADEWGPRLEHLLRNVAFTLLEIPGAHMGMIPRLLSDWRFRMGLVEQVSNPEVRSFWKDEYNRYSPGFRAVVAAPLQNKVGAFLTDPLVRRVLTGPKNSIDLRQAMDEGKILLVNLPKGRIGEGPAALLGSLMVSALSLAGLSRAEAPEERRAPFFCYLDEFHTFATLSLATMLSELRKCAASIARSMG